MATQSSRSEGWPPRIVDEALEVGDEAGDGADEDVAVVDAVGEHVAELAGGGEFFHLPPARGCGRPSPGSAGRGSGRAVPMAPGFTRCGMYRIAGTKR